MKSDSLNKITEEIRRHAIEIGFTDCGFSKVRELSEHKTRLEKWLYEGKNASMKYMANHLEKRVNPSLLEEGAETVISVLLNYFPKNNLEKKDQWVISKYAYGKDYHYIMKSMIGNLLEYIQDRFPDVKGRAFVDSAPVLDRVWAVESGLGWIGKNSNLISPNHGSFVFIGELIINKELINDTPQTKNYCGNCTKCIDACPTDAIISPKTIDANRCLSHATIEYRGDEKPIEIKGKMSNRIYGCDICQDVCPWNIKKAKPTNIDAFDPMIKEDIFTKNYWDDTTNGSFKKRFQSSPIARAGLKQIRRNIQWLEEE
ncbi:tRNA epoxyqueuosine(34) reductase QueG [Halosquirtibacter laminarini]|uniref:tRNA epoxyqueuosine(34) reductase QueG n=1 Tax=Halosquirtibacter laminarini TaxID=3374600 RepID=A0AC61NEZ4_9BACT|nr:tRNA epoxyqueuosine(34) reductase QueG [Prolixibacteraceae bacterium]